MAKWVVINEDYLDYLRHYDSRVPNSNYGPDRYKPFFETLFEHNGFIYVAPVSHPQEKHLQVKNSADFIKLYDGPDSKVPIAIVNLRYMFPVPEDKIKELEYKNIDQYRTFKNDKEKSKYIDLLSKELSIINSMDFERRAKKLYDLKTQYPDNDISKRCIDFGLLEEKAKELISEKAHIQSSNTLDNVSFENMSVRERIRYLQQKEKLDTQENSKHKYQDYER